MASKMEEILEQLQQVNNDLEQSIKEKNVKWQVVNGKRVNKGTIVIDDNQIKDAKELLDIIIKEDINGKSVKTEEHLSKIKGSIEKIHKTLKDMEKNDELKKYKTQKVLVKEVLKMVEPVQTDLTKKEKAIEEYVNKGYDINEHINYEKIQIIKLEKSNAIIDGNFGTLGMVQKLFNEEFEVYNNVSTKEEKIQEIIDLYKELKELNDNIKKEKDVNKKAELTEKINAKRAQILNAQEQYKMKYDDSIDFPKDNIEMDKDGLKKVNVISKNVNDEKKKVSRDFFEKMRNISVEDVKLLEEFCVKFNVNQSDIIGKTDIELVYKIISGKGEELLYEKMLNEQKINKRKQSLEIIEKIDKVKMNYDTINNKKDEDILKQDRAKIEVKKAVDNELEKFNLLMETSKIKRKDLRKALKSSIYSGKRFASIRSFFGSIRKKKALDKVETSYRQTASKEYIKNVRQTVEKEYNEEMDKKKNFSEKYKVIGVEKILSGKTINKSATFEELDEELDR